MQVHTSRLHLGTSKWAWDGMQEGHSLIVLCADCLIKNNPSDKNGDPGLPTQPTQPIGPQPQRRWTPCDDSCWWFVGIRQRSQESRHDLSSEAGTMEPRQGMGLPRQRADIGMLDL